MRVSEREKYIGARHSHLVRAASTRARAYVPCVKGGGRERSEEDGSHVHTSERASGPREGLGGFESDRAKKESTLRVGGRVRVGEETRGVVSARVAPRV